ncbi:MAG TPA: YaaR family protein [Firmicutes bacterium]|nr:YaaR family protein [Bacillota bacterium]HOQ24306.1 YaaR family protein [Bacillota bacterium]HPT67467.1 YaaR family protein [Bacillota bacterium]
MRIEERHGAQNRLERPETDLPRATLDSSCFRTTLATVTDQTGDGDNLEEILAQVDQAGKELAKNRGPAALKSYREAVRRFLEATVRQSFQMKDDRRWDRRGNLREYKIIVGVNQQLEELARMVLEEQTPKMQILAKLDEIRGLLVDLMI